MVLKAGYVPSSAKLKKVLELIVASSVYAGNTITGEAKYDVYQDLLPEVLDVTAATVKKYLKTLADEGCISYVPPLAGKAIKLLREPTQEDYRIVDVRRNTELNKVAMVTEYCRCADEKKQAMLDNYFKLKGASKNG